MPNPFTKQSVLRVKYTKFGVEVERLNCMPQTPEIYYPGSCLYGYDEIFETGAYERDMEKNGINSMKARKAFDDLRDAPSGTSFTLNK